MPNHFVWFDHRGDNSSAARKFYEDFSSGSAPRAAADFAVLLSPAGAAAKGATAR